MDGRVDRSPTRLREAIRARLLTRQIATPLDARELAYELLAEEGRLMCRASRAYRAIARRGPGEWATLGLYIRGCASQLELGLDLRIAERAGELGISGSIRQEDGLVIRMLPAVGLFGESAARVVVAMCDELLPDLWEAIDFQQRAG